MSPYQKLEHSYDPRDQNLHELEEEDDRDRYKHGGETTYGGRLQHRYQEEEENDQGRHQHGGEPAYGGRLQHSYHGEEEKPETASGQGEDNYRDLVRKEVDDDGENGDSVNDGDDEDDLTVALMTLMIT
jgi:hypothetical protein